MRYTITQLNAKYFNNFLNSWSKLQHKGPIFFPEYVQLPENIQFYYYDTVLKLEKNTEEAACCYAKKLLTTDEIFNNNFFEDWKAIMSDEERKIITDFEKCNFRALHEHLTNEERDKESMKGIFEEHKYCYLNYEKMELKNYKIPGPTLFSGRGVNPRRGKIIKRVTPENVTINCSKDCIPEGNWKNVTHDTKVFWLAKWDQTVTEKLSYTTLHPTSAHKINRQEEKYDFAHKLKGNIDRIRNKYKEDWQSTDTLTKQKSIAVYLIDTFLLRAGSTKGKDDAETYGCCSLLVKHLTFLGDNSIQLKFLGKMSIDFDKKKKIDPIVYNNLENFVYGKNPEDKLFDELDSDKVNKFLKAMMTGLTMKVFRTYNANTIFEKYLNDFTKSSQTPIEKENAYANALRKVQEECNHTTDATTLENYLDPRVTFAWYVIIIILLFNYKLTKYLI